MKIVVFSRLLRLAVVVALVAGCSSHPDRDKLDRPENPFKTNRDGPGGPKAPQSDKALRLEADQLYRRANQALLEGDTGGAIERYNQLISRYPFSDYSTQAELEKIYAQYRNYQPDEAITGADRFLREHPRHPAADYVQYLKGLTDSGRDEAFTDFLPLDSTKKDVTNARRAYDDFALLLQRYPTSRYASDARKRMVALRNRVADHELSVVKFYVKRGAYVAAAKRSENIIAEFPGAPATAEALILLERSDRKIGLNDEADEILKLIAANKAVFVAAAAKPDRKSRTVPVLVAGGESAAPSAASPTSTVAPQEAATAPVEGPKPPKTIMQKFVGLFDFLDTSKPENTYTVVLPTAGTTTPATQTGAAAANGSDSSKAASGSDAATTDDSGHVINLKSVKASLDYGDAVEESGPAASAASTTPVAVPPAVATTPGLKIDNDLDSKPATGVKNTAATPPPAVAVDAPKKRSLLERFAGLFSFLDPGERDGSSKPSPQTPTDTKVDNTGSTVPAATPDK